MSDLDEAVALWEAKYTADQLKAMLAKGHAIRNDKGDPSYPIEDEEDLRRAVRAVGRGGKSHDTIRAYIVRRAKALGKTDMLPDGWSASGSSKGASESATLREDGILLAEAGQQQSGSRRRVQLIDAGWSKNDRYYPAATLAEAARAKIYPAGTPMYIDHPTASEQYERPERSVRDLAARLVTDARFEGGALVAEAEITGPWRDFVNQMADQIGLSIRAAGTTEYGEVEGRQGPIVTQLTEGISVDFVTSPARGGKILELIESARAVQLAEARNVGAWLESRLHPAFTQLTDDMYGNGRLSRPERISLSSAISDALAAFTARVEKDQPQLYQRDLWAGPDDGEDMAEAARALAEAHGMTANDLNAALCRAVKEAHGGPDVFAWVRDNTDTLVIFSVESQTDMALYQQAYTVNADKTVTLTGDPVEVTASTTYTPVKQPAAEAATNVPAPPAMPTTEGGPMSGTTTGAPAQGGAPLSEADRLRTENTELKSKLAEAELKVAQLGDNAQKLAEAERSLEEARRENLRLRANDAARAKALETLASSTLPKVAHAVVVESVTGANVPLNDDGALDEAKLVEAIKAAIETQRRYLARFAEEAGIGTVRGLGTSGDPNEMTEADLNAGLKDLFTGLGMPDTVADIAAKGR